MSADRERFIEKYGVSRETSADLDHFAQLAVRWSKAINLVSRSTLPHLWDRHFADSAQLLRLAPDAVRHWADLGSGGGFPALVIAILAKPEGRIGTMTLVEVDQRKATFLRTAIRELDLQIRVLTERAESCAPLNADVLSARAFAPLTELLNHASRHLASDGAALFPKGANHRREYKEALERWRFHCETHPSLTDPQAVIYRISEIEGA